MANIDIAHSEWYYLPAITKGGVMFYIDMEEMLTESLDLKKQIAALKKELRSIPEETLLSYAKAESATICQPARTSMESTKGIIYRSRTLKG